MKIGDKVKCVKPVYFPGLVKYEGVIIDTDEYNDTLFYNVKATNNGPLRHNNGRVRSWVIGNTVKLREGELEVME